MSDLPNDESKVKSVNLSHLPLKLALLASAMTGPLPMANWPSWPLPEKQRDPGAPRPPKEPSTLSRHLAEIEKARQRGELVQGVPEQPTSKRARRRRRGEQRHIKSKATANE